MKSLLVVLVVVSAQNPQVPASPQDCLTRGTEYARLRTKEAGAPTPDMRRQIEADRLKIVGDCAAAFDVEKVPDEQLAALIELYTSIQKPELTERAVARGLAAKDPGARGGALVATIRAALRQPKSAERNAQLERYVDQLDALPESALAHQIAGHNALNGYYRADDIDAGIIEHSTWLIETSKKLTPELRKQYGYSVMSAFVNMAEAVAGQGENDRALELLRRAKTELADVPNAVGRIDPVLSRYMLVGTKAPSIVAPAWFNKEGASPLDLTGKVTLLQFTAHWCGPCKESYPGMQRLRQRFKAQPFQVVFHTRTYGYFGAERNLTRDAEIERDRKYFADYGFDIPIAIGPATGDGGDDPVERGFMVGGIPQINVIDKQGRIRLIMIGYDDANEEKLAAFIEKVLAEK